MGERSELTRIKQLQQLLDKDDIESLLVTRREDIRYLSGFTGSAGSLLVTQSRTCLITDFRYKLQVLKDSPGMAVRMVTRDYLTAINDAARSLNVQNLWFDESSFTVELLHQLRRKGLKPRAHRDLIRTLRMRKDRRELASIKKAIRRAEESFKELWPHIKQGAVERDLAMKLEWMMRDRGSRNAAFDTIVASGSNGAMPHATVSNRKIRKGDLVTIDFGAEADGYFCDITRTFCVGGKPSALQKEIHELVLKAQATAIDHTRIGMPCKTIDAFARDLISRAGHGRHFGHGTGHGIGLMVHESPSISKLSKDAVEKGMVFTVEPGVYIPGWGGVRIEDMVHATESGAKVLTSLPRGINGLKTG